MIDLSIASLKGLAEVRDVLHVAVGASFVCAGIGGKKGKNG